MVKARIRTEGFFGKIEVVEFEFRSVDDMHEEIFENNLFASGDNSPRMQIIGYLEVK